MDTCRVCKRDLQKIYCYTRDGTPMPGNLNLTYKRENGMEIWACIVHGTASKAENTASTEKEKKAVIAQDSDEQLLYFVERDW